MRTIVEKIKGEATRVDCDPKQDTDLRAWLTAQAATLVKDHDDKRCWLLAHCEDGVIWGELRDDMLHLSCEAFPTLNPNLRLRWETLQQARLFGKPGELFVWQGPSTWQARVLHEAPGNEHDGYIDEPQLLWGYRRDNETLQRKDGFVLLTEGSQGIVHAPPIGDTTPTEQSRASLLVRHYIGEDEAGVARITHSRVVELV